jgi:hypothetical protein
VQGLLPRKVHAVMCCDVLCYAVPCPVCQVSHTEPDHSFLVPAVLDLYPEATVVASKVALNFLSGLTNRWVGHSISVTLLSMFQSSPCRSLWVACCGWIPSALVVCECLSSMCHVRVWECGLPSTPVHLLLLLTSIPAAATVTHAGSSSSRQSREETSWTWVGVMSWSL